MAAGALQRGGQFFRLPRCAAAFQQDVAAAGMAARLQLRQQLKAAGGEQSERSGVDIQGFGATDFVGQGLPVGQHAADQPADGGAHAQRGAESEGIDAQADQGAGGGSGAGADAVFFEQLAVERVAAKGVQRRVAAVGAAAVEALEVEQLALQHRFAVTHLLLHLRLRAFCLQRVVEYAAAGGGVQ